MAGPVPSRPFGDDQTAGFDALVVGVLFVFFALKCLNVLNVLRFLCVCVSRGARPAGGPFLGDWFLVERGGPLEPSARGP